MRKILVTTVISAVLVAAATVGGALLVSHHSAFALTTGDALSVDAVPGGTIDSTASYPVGAGFAVDIVITAAPNAYSAYQASLAYDPAIVTVDNIDTSADPPNPTQRYVGNAFLCDGGSQLTPPPFTSIYTGCTRTSGTSTAVGSPFTWYFHCVNAGATTLHLVTDAEAGVATGTNFVIAAGAADATTHDATLTCSGMSPPVQTITFPPPPDRNYGDPDFDLAATATSGLPITFAVSGACSLSSATVHIISAGSCTAIASQAGDSTWDQAPDVVRSFAIRKVNQMITVTLPGSKRFDEGPVTVSASASSGLPVSFSTLTPNNCTVAGTTVAFVNVGTCSLQANQSGNANYNAAAQQASFQITKGNQSVSFAPLLDRYVGAPDFTVDATASSGLTILWGVSGDCTNPSSNVIHLTATSPGSCTVTAFQLGNGNWNAAPSVARPFNVLANPDSDGDGCFDQYELGPDHLLGGQRDAQDAWDFYDVPFPALRLNPAGKRDGGIGVTTDVIALVAYSGRTAMDADYVADYDANGVQDGLQYDRTMSTTPGEPWRSGAPDGGIGVTSDVVAMLAQAGNTCPQPPATPTPTRTNTPTAVPTATETWTPTITPTPSATSTGAGTTVTPLPTIPGMPDLIVQSVSGQPYRTTGPSCLYPGTGTPVPAHTDVVVANIGDADAGQFAVSLDGTLQTISGLQAGQSATISFGGYSYVAFSVTVDALAEVPESDEHNTWVINFYPGGTPFPTPTGTLPPSCTPTRTATPTPTLVPTVTPTP